MRTSMFLLTASLVLLMYLDRVVTGHPHKGLTTWFDTEQRLLNKLEIYIKQQEVHIQFLERQLREISATVPRHLSRERYLSHPINNFVLIRRLVYDWPSIAKIGANFRESSPQINWPGDRETRMTVRTLVRLQKAYKLNTKNMARGLVLGDPADVDVIGWDSLLIAADYTINQEPKMANEWLGDGIAKLGSSMSTVNLFGLYVISGCFSGDSKGSMSALIKLLEKLPFYEPSLFQLEAWQIMVGTDCPTHKQATENLRWHLSSDEDEKMKKFGSLCRVATGSSLQPQHVLSCRYVHYNKTWLRLGPFRVEELQLDPPVLLFHNIISDAEIKEVQRSATKKLETSEVVSDSGYVVGDDRTSESAVLPPGYSGLVDRLAGRMGDLTDLDPASAEVTQVTRYGPGGEYFFHHDYFDMEKIPSRRGPKRNRLATLMIYLSEVPRGGHTVFRYWGLSVRPQKGAGLFWFNLHRNGTGDISTEHAGCPVLSGTKWILNKWFLTAGESTPNHEDEQKTFKYFYI